LLEKTLAVLEGAKFCCVFASGCAAITTLILTMEAGDHIILGHDVYAGTLRLARSVFSSWQLQHDLVDLRDLNALRSSIKPDTRMIFFETPTNPLLDVIDIAAVCDLVKDQGIMVCVDNTFASPYLQNPLKLGASVVVHSSTKYIGGHSDVIGGAVLTNDPELFSKLLFLQNAVGAVPSPFDCFLLLRSLKTLAVRMERHCSNAEKIANYLISHPKVRNVRYPGLETHTGRHICAKQMRRFGGMISFELNCSSDQVRLFLKSLRLFKLAESLGGVESLIEVPSIMTHGYLSPDERAKLKITDTFIRLSCGIEDVDDLIEDLGGAFDTIA
ncbi:MAG: PLP-dependent aspartate aminotransferase family protein, partial [Deltaproteobacteria bacterium]|nr:PLP-dependent aspartate aminotransferase family protein [Deltaproteobacteria bacterium]